MAFAILSAIGFVGSIAALLYLLYRSLLPKPIPGIPHNHAATKSLLGDLSALLRTGRQDPHNWMVEQCIELKSPIIQAFMRPFRSPWIVLTDYQEANDIMTRRTREFDRSDFFGDLFITMLPQFQAHMKTGEQWKSHRKLTGDLMASSFLNDTLSERIHEATQDLITLWKEKSRLANGRPFEAKQDISCATLDGTWASTFGSQIGVTVAKCAALASVEISLVSDKDAPCRFPAPPLPPAFHSIIKLTQSLEISAKSPFARLHHWVALNLYPDLRSARLHKDQLIQDRLEEATKKFSQRSNDGKAKSAIDLLVQREVAMAEKEHRTPGKNTQAIKDEMFGFLLAGHDTTAITLCWGLKFMAQNVDSLTRLRSDLERNFVSAIEGRRNPTAREIATADVPYFDAVIEEIHRCGRTAPSVIRRSTCDTKILGYAVPKGTDVFMQTHGPSYESPAMQIDDIKRSATSRQNKDRPYWLDEDIGKFKPERWLSGSGEDAVFNPKAGPSHPFGAGPRACFGRSLRSILFLSKDYRLPHGSLGRKLGTLQLKIELALTVWNFELLPTPPALSSFRQHDVLTGEPEQCYVRLARVIR